MSWRPILSPGDQVHALGQPASGYYIKLYKSGTTTPTNMATDDTGGTTLDKCQINTAGYPVNGSSAPFVPHIDQKYRYVLYSNSTDADANTFANAVIDIDAIPFGGQLRDDLANTTDTTLGFNLVKYHISAEETAAAVTPVNYQYRWGDLRRYGGDETGVADSTSAFQDACAVADQVDGLGEVYKCAGKFKVTPQTIYTGSIYYCVNLASMTGIRIHGPGEILVSMGGLRSTAFHLNASTDIEIGPTRLAVETTSANQCGFLYSKNSDNITVDGIDIYSTDANSDIEGIIIAETSNTRFTVKNCKLPSTVTWNSGIAFYDDVQDIQILNNYFSGGQLYYAIDVERKGTTTENVLIDGNEIHDAPWTPIHSIADNTVITNNIIDTVTDNMAAGADTWDCIRMTDCNGGVIANNVCKNADYYGISVYRGNGIIIDGNKTSGNTLGGCYIWATNSGGSCTDITIGKDNQFSEDPPVVFLKNEKFVNVKDLRPDANNKIFDIGHMIDWGTGGVHNPVFTSTLTTATRATHAHPYGNTSLNFPASASGSQQIYLTFPAEFWTPLKGKYLLVTLNYDFDASFTGNPRFRMQDGVNDWNISLPVQNSPLDQSFVFPISASATQLILRLYMHFSSATTNNAYYNFMTIGGSEQDRAQQKFATAVPNIATYNGDTALDPTATATPFKWVYSGGAWRVLI